MGKTINETTNNYVNQLSDEEQKRYVDGIVGVYKDYCDESLEQSKKNSTTGLLVIGGLLGAALFGEKIVEGGKKAVGWIKGKFKKDDPLEGDYVEKDSEEVEES